MTPTVPPILDPARLKAFYEWSEQEYIESLPLEHFMESVAHAAQRKITVESFGFIHVRRPDIQCFNELLIQYPRSEQDPKDLGQVVPDNMVVIHEVPIVADGSFNTPFQPAGPYLVLEYVSKASRAKDYEDNFDKYEQGLKVPYYLLFNRVSREVTLYHLVDEQYREKGPGAKGRYEIPEMELELALHDGWVRYWFRGELLALSEELLLELDELKKKLEATQTKLDATQDQLEATQTKLDATQDQLEETQTKLGATHDQLEETQTKLDATHDQLEATETKLDASQNQLEAERQARLAADAENAKLREELKRLKPKS